MRRVKVALVTAVLVLSVVLISACSINESAVEAVGGIYITAMDTTQGIHLATAQVLVDNVPRSHTLPVFIGGLEAGRVEVSLKPGLLYPPSTQTANVSPPETTFVSFTYSADTPPSTVTIESNVPNATIVVDEQLQSSIDVGVPFLIAAGNHSISLFKPGFITNALNLNTDLVEDQDYTFTIDLTESEYGNQTGELFPDFTFPDDWGGEHTLGQYRGQVVLVSFWFYTCVPCREEFPVVEQVFQERAADGFRVLAVNTAWFTDGQEEFESIREQLGLSFPLLFNTNGQDWTNNDLAIVAAPTNFILSPSGEIYARRGQITYESLNELIDGALGGE